MPLNILIFYHNTAKCQVMGHKLYKNHNFIPYNKPPIPTPYLSKSYGGWYWGGGKKELE